MDILSLTIAALAGISANFIFDLLKKLLSLKKDKRVTVKLPDGVTYELNISKGNKMEFEKLIRSVVYSTEKTPSVRTSNVRVLEDVIRPSLAAIKNKFDEAEINIELQGFDQLPAVLVDPDAIQQVVFNLLMNAIKYSPRKSTIKLNATTSKNVLEIRFINPTIAGIHPEETERIFEMGFRGVEASRKDPSGMGAGLYVVRNLLKAHGGDVSVKSDNNLFETTINLPLKQEMSQA